MPSLIMLVGIPASGKSTWVKEYLSVANEGYIIISSDEYIEKKAKEEGKTYSEVFTKYVKDAEQYTLTRAKNAIAFDVNVIWDQTNLTKNSRKKRLAMFPDHYSKYFKYFPEPEYGELSRRLTSRPGKVIPEDVLKRMKESVEIPSIEEGFHGSVS